MVTASWQLETVSTSFRCINIWTAGSTWLFNVEV